MNIPENENTPTGFVKWITTYTGVIGLSKKLSKFVEYGIFTLRCERNDFMIAEIDGD